MIFPPYIMPKGTNQMIIIKKIAILFLKLGSTYTKDFLIVQIKRIFNYYIYFSKFCNISKEGTNMGFVLFNHKTNNDDKHIETKFILAHEVRMIINIMMIIVMIKTNWVKDWVVSNVKFREAFL